MDGWMNYQSLPPSFLPSILGLTDAVAEDDGQQHGDPHGNQGGALPGAVFGRLLELERPPGQAVPWQRTRRRGVNRPRRHGVARGGRAEERCGPRAGLKEEMPGGKSGRERIV